MELTLTTPALLFPAISLLLLAYTSRFLAIAALIRDLYSRYKAQPDERLKGQLRSLQYRIKIIRDMQVCGVASFFGCVLCMILLFTKFFLAATWVFGGSLVLLLVSLALSLREVQVSIDALSLQVHDIDGVKDQKES